MPGSWPRDTRQVHALCFVRASPATVSDEAQRHTFTARRRLALRWRARRTNGPPQQQCSSDAYRSRRANVGAPRSPRRGRNAPLPVVAASGPWCRAPRLHVPRRRLGGGCSETGKSRGGRARGGRPLQRRRDASLMPGTMWWRSDLLVTGEHTAAFGGSSPKPRAGSYTKARPWPDHQCSRERSMPRMHRAAELGARSV